MESYLSEALGRRVTVPDDERPATVNDLLGRLVDELADGEVTAALGQPFTLGALWADLCRLAGEEPPLLVRVLIGDDAVDEAA